MAHFAELDAFHKVTRVLVVADKDTQDSDNNEVESIGTNFLNKVYGGTWVQTSYNGSIRKNYAGIGYEYDVTRDAFISPQPYNSWTLDEDTCQWEPPVAYPTDGKRYEWNEDSKSWST